MVTCAIDLIASNPELIANLGRVGLVVNQASTAHLFRPSVEVFASAADKVSGTQLSCLFGPQHGYGQTEQDNMIETDDTFFMLPNGTSVPLYSLYSKTRIPTAEQLYNIDTLVVDLQDIGCRVYTYMLTLAGCLRAGAEHGKRVVVLDRPNPIGLSQLTTPGRFTQGNCLDMMWQSFVGWYPIPMRHGLSLGELGHYFIKYDSLNVDYKVIAVAGLRRGTTLASLSQQPWTIPSPNLPTWLTAYCFPAFVALETTSISEGRGTTLPFQTIGSPQLNVRRISEILEHWNRTAPEEFRFCGLHLRQHTFRPTFNKHQGLVCEGLQFHAIDPGNNNLMALGSVFLAAAASEFEGFEWKAPGYEYNMVDPPVHLVLGNSRWKQFFDSIRGRGWSTSVQDTLQEILCWSETEAAQFEATNENCHIYQP